MTQNIRDTPAFKERQEQILKELTDSAKAIVNQVPRTFPRKKIFPRRGGERLRRRNRVFAQAELVLISRMAAFRMAVILSQPIPRDNAGRIYPSGIAMAGEKSEEVVKLGEHTWHIPKAFPTPPGFR